jgi:hypothetical protein
MLEINIKRFEELILSDRVAGRHLHEQELSNLFITIAEALGQDYITYRKYFPVFLDVLETHQTEANLYGIKIFQHLYRLVFKDVTITPFDLDLFNYETNVELTLRCNEELEKILSRGIPVRISDNPLDLNQFSHTEKEEMAAAYIRIIEDQIKNSNWEKIDYETTHMLLLPLHQLLKETGRSEMFFYNVGALLDKFASTEIFQQARNLSEEAIIMGFDDGWPDLGFWVAFRVYAGCHNPLGAFLTGAISLIISCNKRNSLSDQRAFDILCQSVRLFRNVGLVPWAIQLYEERPLNIPMSDYRRRTFTHTYFTCLLAVHDDRLPDLALDFLNTERETIFAVGTVEAKPWLILLWQIQRGFVNADMSPTGLGYYLNVFTAMMPKEDVQSYRDVIMADTDAIIEQLKESIIKLRSTSYKSDFVYDNDAALLKSNRVLNYSAEHENDTGFLLAMLIKSDFSILFQSKDQPDLAPFTLPEIDVSELSEIYDRPAELLAEITHQKPVAVIWLGIEQDGLRQMTYFDNQFYFHTPSQWDSNKYRKLVGSGYFANLTFDESIKQRGQVRQLFEDDFLKDKSLIINDLSFVQIQVPPNAQAVHIVKDIVLSAFPHNLFLNETNNFISEHLPVTNILSTEWIKDKQNIILNPDFSKSIWIPTESNDFTLHMLFSKLEKTLFDNHFLIQQTVKPSTAISAELNIACAHGADNISDLELIQFGKELEMNLEQFIGHGKILVLFICHSGSATHPLFRNETANLIKKFIMAGYEAVIAPAWGLHIKVAEIWLPEFLHLFQNGSAIDEAVFGANKKVYEYFPTPAAWAALHLYGNPNLFQAI